MNTNRIFFLMAALLATHVSTTSLEARIWKSANGNFEIDAEVVSFSNEIVVLKRKTGELVAVNLEELSKEDREYVQSKEATAAHKKSLDEMQTWTAVNGMKVEGRVLAFGRKELVLQRRFGRVEVNGTVFSKLDGLHQKLVLRIMSVLEKMDFKDEQALRQWAVSLGGEPKVYPLEGVLMQLASGDEVGVPFFLFCEEDLKILQPGWETWVAAQDEKENYEREDFLMRSQAMAYQRDREAQQQIEMLKLDLLAAAAGVVDIWQVGMVPGPGVFGRPMTVVVPARDSFVAGVAATERYPGYVVVGVQRANRRF